MSAECCRLCGTAPLRTTVTLPRVPANISRLLPAGGPVDDHPVTLRLLQCDECGLAQLAEAPAKHYYDDYLMTVSHSPQMRAYQQAQAAEFVARHGLTGRRVIEVGCGDGHYLACLAAAGAVPVGLEPSARFRDLVAQRGFECHAGYVSRDAPAPGRPYAAFVTRQVLEHVLDLRGFLAGLRASIVADGAGLIEVPSFEQTLENGRFFDLFPDHVNYFTDRTLRLACELAGLAVTWLTRGMNGEYLVAWVQHALFPDAQSLEDAVRRTCTALAEFVAQQRSLGRRVAAWGAGGKGLTTLAAAQVAGLEYVIDSDPHKVGRLTPVSHLRVVPPETLKHEPVDAIVLTALAYREEIIRQCRELLGFRGTIAVLGPTLELV